jgi:hypothetical protein
MASRPISSEGLKARLEEELSAFKSEGIQAWDLYLKQQEIRKWLPKQDPAQIRWVERLIWKPKGRSDFRRLIPELVFLKSSYQMQARNIWGEPITREIPSTDPLDQHWKILRKLISTARDSGGGGMRTLKFLVRDRVSRKYLGVICISSDFMDLVGRDKLIGWKKNEFQRPQGLLYGKLNHIAQGQAIVPTQPFGSAYNGVKLLALLCLSNEISEKWEEIYGEKLVAVTTTALWGNAKAFSSYDGLEPYWQRLQDTSGNTPMKFSDDTYQLMKDWLKINEPNKHFDIFDAKKPDGSPKTRDSKSKCIQFVMQRLGIPISDRKSNAIRLAYMSQLYKNSADFLRGEVTEDKLIPAFFRTTDELVKFWRFGIKGDTIRKMTNAEKKKFKADNPWLPTDYTRNLASSAKARTDDRVRRAKEKQESALIPTQGPAVEWYESLAHLSWAEAKARYLKEIGR